jgi:hypothetical protein
MERLQTIAGGIPQSGMLLDGKVGCGVTLCVSLVREIVEPKAAFRRRDSNPHV